MGKRGVRPEGLGPFRGRRHGRGTLGSGRRRDRRQPRHRPRMRDRSRSCRTCPARRGTSRSTRAPRPTPTRRSCSTAARSSPATCAWPSSPPATEGTARTSRSIHQMSNSPSQPPTGSRLNCSANSQSSGGIDPDAFHRLVARRVHLAPVGADGGLVHLLHHDEPWPGDGEDVLHPRVAVDGLGVIGRRDARPDRSCAPPRFAAGFPGA